MWHGLPGIWTKRIAFGVHDVVGVASSDVDVSLDPSLDEFWDAIDAGGLEIRAVAANGALLTYRLRNAAGTGAFNSADRAGTLRVNDLPLPAVAGSVTLFHLYYGSTAVQGTAEDTVATYSGTLTGRINVGLPGQYAFVHQPPVLNQTKPRFTFVKRSSEYVHVYYDVSPALAQRATPAYGALFHETPWYATYRVVDTAEVTQAGMADAANMRWVWDGQRHWLRCPVQAGNDLTNYTMNPLVRTIGRGQNTVQQVIEGTVGVRVENAHHTS